MDCLVILPYNLRFVLTRLGAAPNGEEQNKDSVPKLPFKRIASYFTLLAFV
jgi:hypothetical protein